MYISPGALGGKGTFAQRDDMSLRLAATILLAKGFNGFGQIDQVSATTQMHMKPRVCSAQYP